MQVVLEAVSFGYSRRNNVLSDLSTEVTNFPLAVLGPNGAGKSTLLSLLAGQFELGSGRIKLSTQSGVVETTSRDRRRLTSLMPQDIRPLMGFTVNEQIAYSGWLKGMRHRQSSQAAFIAARAVNLANLNHVSVKKLSGGQRRRLGIASAIVSAPPLLLLDEPYAGLDPEQRGSVRTALREMGDTSLVISTHQTEDLDEFYKSVVVIDHGRILFAGSTGDFLAEVPDGVSPSDRAEVAYRRVIRARRDESPS